MEARARKTRGARKNQRISISVTAEDLKLLRGYAKRAHGGSISAVLHEMVADLKREEARRELIKMLGADRVTEEAIQAMRDEIAGVAPRRRRRKAA
jgi:hypothetical protein